MSDAFTLLDPIMQFTLPDVAQRVLGQQDIAAGPTLVLAYWNDPSAHAEWGPYTITTFVNRTGPIAPYMVFRVNGVNLGTDANGNAVTVNIRFFGQSSGVTTVVTRAGWYFVPIQHLWTNFMNRLTGQTGTTGILLR